jgi:glycosyltransferase involved in cell wall biosynthesis
MATSNTPDLIYLGRSRLHRNRANLIQTLHTVAALTELGVNIRLYLPPWHSSVTLKQRLREMGIDSTPDIRASQLLHRRWPATAFARVHRRLLRRARAVYVRSEHLSLALASVGIRHHFEVHAVEPLIKQGQLESLTAYHRQGVIDWLIPISQSAAKTLIDAGAVQERIHVSPSGVDLSAFNGVTPLQASRMSTPRMVYLGRISNDRGLGILLHLARQNPGQLLLVGDKDDEIPITEGLIQRPPVPHRQIPSLYEQSEMVILPYQPDLIHADSISPMKLFEAMAAGRVIIASDMPTLREILTDGQNALLVDPQDPLAWEGAVERLRHQPELAERLARQAREDAAAYAWRQRAEGILRAIGLATSSCTSS